MEYETNKKYIVKAKYKLLLIVNSSLLFLFSITLFHIIFAFLRYTYLLRTNTLATSSL